MKTSSSPARPLRVLHLITRLDRGGSTMNTLLTVAGLSASLQPTIVYGRTRELPALALELQSKVPMQEIPELVREPDPVKDLIALGKLYRLMRRERFDLVHTHSSKAGILGRLAARAAGVPRIVHTPHGHVFWGYAGRLLTKFFIRLERWAATFTDRIVGLTEQEVRDHLQHKIGRPEQFVTIPSGVPVERFGHHSLASARALVRGTWRLPPEAFLIGSVGRVEPVKGHIYLLEAFIALAARFSNLHLALVGDGTVLPELRSRAQQAGVGGRALFLGWRDDISALLHAFDLFVLPSLNEGMGRALVEAMAVGLPIIASRAGSIAEVLDEGKSGLLVRPASAQALARGIEQLLADPALRVELAERARERARDFSTGAMLEKLGGLYRELLGVRGGTS